jgi:hypothetical protein
VSVYVNPQPLAYFVGSRGFPNLPGAVAGPYRAFELASPSTTAIADPAAVSLGVEFYVTSACNLTDIYWWQPTTGSDASARTVALFITPDITQVVSNVTGDAPVVPGWQSVAVGPYALTPLTRYVAVVYHPGGSYSAAASYFTGADIVNGPLVVPGAANATNTEQGTYAYGGALAFPTEFFGSANYWVDVSVT